MAYLKSIVLSSALLPVCKASRACLAMEMDIQNHGGHVPHARHAPHGLHGHLDHDAGGQIGLIGSMSQTSQKGQMGLMGIWVVAAAQVLLEPYRCSCTAAQNKLKRTEVEGLSIVAVHAFHCSWKVALKGLCMCMQSARMAAAATLSVIKGCL